MFDIRIPTGPIVDVASLIISSPSSPQPCVTLPLPSVMVEQLRVVVRSGLVCDFLVRSHHMRFELLARNRTDCRGNDVWLLLLLFLLLLLLLLELLPLRFMYSVVITCVSQ